MIQLVKALNIERIIYENIQGSLHYTIKDGGALLLHGDHFKLKTQFAFYDRYFYCSIENFTNNTLKTKLHGDIVIDPSTLESFSKINILINEDANLTLYTKSNTQAMRYTVKAHNTIRDPKYIVNLFSLPKEVKYWAHDAITLHSLALDKFYGVIQFDNLASSYKSLHVLATAHKLDYRYNRSLDAIHTQYTKLEFTKGVLYIRPHEGLTYGIQTEQSWLKIDFTPPQEILTLYLKLAPQLDDNILAILKAYKIKVPVRQLQGTTQTTMVLTINLRTIAVDAKGDFRVDTGKFSYLGEIIDIHDLHLKLDNYNISFDNMSASMQGILKAQTSLRFNAKTTQGKLDINITKLTLPYPFSPQNLPLHVTYTITPNEDTLQTAQSLWDIGGNTLHLDSLQAKVNLSKRTLKLFNTPFSIPSLLDGTLKGNIDLKNKKTTINFDISKFAYKGIQTTQPNTHLMLTYDKDLSLIAPKTLSLDISGTPLKIQNFNLAIHKDTLFTKNTTKFYFGKYTQSDIFAKYNFKTAKAQFNLRNLQLKNPFNDTMIYKKKQLSLSAVVNKRGIQLNAPKIATTFQVNNKKWILKLNNISKLYRDSALLQQYRVDNGSLRIYKLSHTPEIKFSGHTRHHYAVFRYNDKPITDYRFQGKLNADKHLSLTLNHAVTFLLEDTLDIMIKNYFISLPEVMKLLREVSDKDTQTTTLYDTKIVATNSGLYLGDSRSIPADTINMRYIDKILDAQLFYKAGSANLQITDETFKIYGSGFNDIFMEKVFRFSNFKGGRFDFNVAGNFTDYQGVFYLTNTRVLNYTLLNNLFAFINTVPALITFSVPNYSVQGFFIKNAYMRFHYKNDLYYINDLYVDSNDMQISAKGKANRQNDTISMDMTLKTNIGSSLSKIPVVGYIIFDGKSLATTVEISGKLSDPTVEPKIAQEVLISPLNIIKRTLQLPSYLLEGKK